MSTSQEDIEKFEKRYKEQIYGKIGTIASLQSRIITQIGEIGKYVDIDTDIPNMGITFNNKLVELSQQFKRAGISLFADPNENYDIIGTNFVGDAIIGDMISRLVKGNQSLKNYDSSMEKANSKRTEKLKSLEKSGPIKKMFLKIRSLFVPNTVPDLKSFSEEEIGELNSYLSEYKEANNGLLEYNLRDNVVESIAKFVQERQYSDSNITELLKESVIPTLQKLGLEDGIPKLQEEIRKYQEKRKPWNLPKDQKKKIQEGQQKAGQQASAIESQPDGIPQNESPTNTEGIGHGE